MNGEFSQLYNDEYLQGDTTMAIPTNMIDSDDWTGVFRVNFTGGRAQPINVYSGVNEARMAYKNQCRELEVSPLSPLYAIHAERSARPWNADRLKIYGASFTDLSCLPDRCDCQSLGFPLKDSLGKEIDV